jgi:hypothetical protein
MQMSSSMSRSTQLFFEYSSSSDDSDIEELLDDDIKQYIVLLEMKELEDRKKRPGSKVGRLCIPKNRMLGHSMLMRDYFAEVPHLSGSSLVDATECVGLFLSRL